MNKKTKLFLTRKLPIFLLIPTLAIPFGYSFTSSISESKKTNLVNNSNIQLNKPFDPIDKSNSIVFSDQNQIENSLSNLTTYSSNEPFNQVHSTNLGFNQSINLFNQLTDFSKFEGNGEYINYDLKNYGINLLRKHLNNFVVEDLAIKNILVNDKVVNQKEPNKTVVSKVNNLTEISTNNKHSIRFNDKISFDYQIKFRLNKKQSLNVANKSFVIEANKPYVLSIKAHEQAINPVVNDFAGNNYLGWEVNEVSFNLNNTVWNDVLNITNNYFSNVFKTQILKIENKLSYFDVVKNNQNLLDEYVNDQFKLNLQKRFDDEFIHKFSLISDVNKVLYDLLKDETTSVVDVLKNNFTTILGFLARSGLINNYFVDIAIKAFKLDTKQGLDELVNKPFYELVRTKKDDVLKAIGIQNDSLINTLLGSYEPLFNGISQDFDLSFIFTPLKGLIKQDALFNNLEKIIRTQLFGLEKTQPKSLFDLIFDNLDLIKQLLAKFINNKTVNGFINLLTTKNKDEKYSNFYDFLFAGRRDKKQEVINLLLEAFNKTNDSNIKDLVKTFYTDNFRFSKPNFVKFAKNLVTFTNGFFGKKADLENKEKQNKSLTKEVDFFDSFANLKFHKQFKKFEYDKKTHKLSYEYEIKFELIKPVEFTLFEDLKRLVNIDAILKLLATVLGNKNPLKGHEAQIKITNLETVVKQLLPDKITFGIKELKEEEKAKNKTSSYSFFFKADDQVWLEPVLNQQTNNYELGINYPVQKGFKFEDYNAIESLTKQFENKQEQVFNLNAFFFSVATIKASLKGFYTSLIQELFLKPISTYSRQTFVNKNIIVSNTKEFDISLFNGINFDGIELQKQDTDAIKTLLKNYKNKQGDTKFFKPNEITHEPNKTFMWKGAKTAEALNGLNPIVSEELANKLKEVIEAKLEPIKALITKNKLSNYMYDVSYNIKHVLTPSLSLNIEFVKDGFVANQLGGLKGQTIKSDVNLGYYSLEIKINLPFKVFDKKANALKDSYVFNISEFTH